MVYKTNEKEKIDFEYKPSRSETQDGVRKDYVTGDPHVFVLPKSQIIKNAENFNMEQILFKDLTVMATGRPMRVLERASESKKYQLKQ